jgi:hypothetical protein
MKTSDVESLKGSILFGFTSVGVKQLWLNGIDSSLFNQIGLGKGLDFDKHLCKNDPCVSADAQDCHYAIYHKIFA